MHITKCSGPACRRCHFRYKTHFGNGLLIYISHKALSISKKVCNDGKDQRGVFPVEPVHRGITEAKSSIQLPVQLALFVNIHGKHFYFCIPIGSRNCAQHPGNGLLLIIFPAILQLPNQRAICKTEAVRVYQCESCQDGAVIKAKSIQPLKLCL